MSMEEATFQIHSAFQRLNTFIQRTAMNMIKPREKITAFTNKLSSCIWLIWSGSYATFLQLVVFNEKYPNPLSLKYKSIYRCYTAVVPQILSARISVSHGWMKDPFIFNLNSADDSGRMMEDPVEMKASRKIKMNFHLMQLDTFWCMQFNTSPQLAKAALKVLVPFATNNLW